VESPSGSAFIPTPLKRWREKELDQIIRDIFFLLFLFRFGGFETLLLPCGPQPAMKGGKQEVENAIS